MPELRKDYITHGWVVISTERGSRPVEKAREPATPSSAPGNCPFCMGNEAMTPPEILAYRSPGTQPNTPGWWIRVVPNKFPALKIEGDVNHKVNHLFNTMNGVGAHEVLIETPEHCASLATLPDHQVKEVLCAYKDRYNDLTRDRRLKYIIIFKNQGREAGASLAHPHSQIIATPMIPRRIMDELEGARNYYFSTGGSCIYDDIVKYELEEGTRVVRESGAFVALCPYASRFPYETWVLPKSHDPIFEDVGDEERAGLAQILKWVLGAMHDRLEDPPYNYYIHTAPSDRNDYRFYHWHLEIMPRLSQAAGFERGTGFYINSVTPEDAAALLRAGPRC
ncbi:MAG: galactose-1-phosphate uridylyltransferase [Thermoplasmatota archaeon]